MVEQIWVLVQARPHLLAETLPWKMIGIPKKSILTRQEISFSSRSRSDTGPWTGEGETKRSSEVSVHMIKQGRDLCPPLRRAF